MTTDMDSPEQRRPTGLESRPVSIEEILSPAPEKIRELVEQGTWHGDYEKVIAKRLPPEEIPTTEIEGKTRVLRVEATVKAIFRDEPLSIREEVEDRTWRLIERGEINVGDPDITLIPLVENLRPLVQRLTAESAKPPEPTISETDKAKLRRFDLLDRGAKQAGIEQGISGALSELQKTQRALGAAQEAMRKKADELTRQLQERNKRIKTMLRDISKGEKERQGLREELQEAQKKNKNLGVTVNAQRKTMAEFGRANKALREKNEDLEKQLEKRKPRQAKRLEPRQGEREQGIRVSVGAQKDIGKSRDRMEDDFGLVEPKDRELLAQRGCLYVVTDGMGGHLAGEVASGLAVEIISNDYYQEKGTIAEALNKAIQKANRQIYREAQKSAKKGMGTTVVAAVVRGDELYVAHAGDSRAYLIRNGAIHQLTEDHSWVHERAKEGALTPEEARRHPYRNVITRSLGSEPEVKLGLKQYKINQRDIVLLCTDGLTEMVDNEKIKALILGSPNPQVAAQRLIEQANFNGDRDNIAAVVIKVEQIG